MADGWRRVSLDDVETSPEKPGERWELSSALGVDAFNFTIAILDPEDRLSQNPFTTTRTSRSSSTSSRAAVASRPPKAG